jgi:ketosteroid isomerase-like protein
VSLARASGAADYDASVPDNVDLVRRSFAAISAWDVDALIRLYHPDAQFLPLTGTRVESGGYHGHAGIRAYMQEAEDLWDVLQPTGEHFEDFGDYVVVAGHCRVRGRMSGAESDPTCGWVVEIRDGLIFSHRACSSYEEALDVAGVRPAEDPAGSAGQRDGRPAEHPAERPAP